MCRIARPAVCCALAACFGLSGRAAGELTFAVTDITGWSSGQLDGLAHFQRWVPYAPAGAPSDFAPNAHNTSGQTAGDGPGSWGDRGYVADDLGSALLPPYGDYYWSYTTCDTHDCHFYNGRVEFTHASDINASGLAVGDSTLPGVGSISCAYTAHAVAFDAATAAMTDLTPAANKAAATAVNDAGLIAGWLDDGAGARAFVRFPNGRRLTLDTFAGATQANAINANGLVVGHSTTRTFTGTAYLHRKHPFANADGAAIVDMGLPTQNGVDEASAGDVNAAGWAVGSAWRNDESWVHFATLWQEDAGDWTPTDLNELIDTDVILENAIAVNEVGYIIARGRPDGTDTYGSNLYLLTPSEWAVPVDAPRPVPVVVPGDADGDGHVDADDLAVLADRWQLPATLNEGDFNGDGVVNVVDLGILAGQWGTGGPAGVGFADALAAANVPVPEPATGWLLVGAAVAARRRRGA